MMTKDIIYLYVQNRKRKKPIRVELVRGRINILHLRYGDYLEELPKVYNSGQVPKLLEGPRTLKIYVSNVNEHDMYFEIVGAYKKARQRIALAHFAYPIKEHFYDTSKMKKAKRSKIKTNVVELFPYKKIRNIFRKPNKED
jgi:hypothetical protein